MKIVISKNYSVVTALKMSVDDAYWTTSFLRKVMPRDHARRASWSPGELGAFIYST